MDIIFKGNVNIENYVLPGATLKNEYQGTVYKGMDFSKNLPTSCFPDELDTEEARELLQKAVDANLLTDDFQPNGISMPEAALLASEISQKLWEKNSWKPFEALWNCSGLSAYLQKAINNIKSKDFIGKLREIYK